MNRLPRRLTISLLAAVLTLAASTHAETVLEKWVKRYNGPTNRIDRSSAVAVDADGNVIVTGESTGTGTTTDNGDDYYTAKYAAADGALLWERRHDGIAHGNDRAGAVALDNNGNAIVTGASEVGEGQYISYTAKYAAADGALLWERRYEGPGFGSTGAVAMDQSGNVIIAGSIGGDYYTAKLAGADGVSLWESRYHGPGNGADGAAAVVLDGAGNAIVTGSSYGIAYQSDFYTAKYAAVDGALLWERRYDGMNPGAADFPQALAVDRSGNVIVAGYSAGVLLNTFDSYTAKYAASDGSLLWERRRSGRNFSSAGAVAVDQGGNVFITGLSDGDSYTAKYAASDGTLLWERLDHGGGAAVTVDAGGNVVVTGNFFATDTGFDYYTAKYAGTSGALLWEMRYNGPDSRDDYIDGNTHLALTPDGGVVVTGFSRSTSSRDDYATVKYGPPNTAPYPQWKIIHFGNSAAPDLGDSDHDGLATLAEYGLLLSPGTPSQAPGASVFTYAEGDRLRMFVPRDPERNDITVSVEATSDFVAGPWAPLATSTFGEPFIGPGYVGGDSATPGVKSVEVRDIVNISSAPQRWLQIRVVH